jgi:hypothetical protein
MMSNAVRIEEDKQVAMCGGCDNARCLARLLKGPGYVMPVCLEAAELGELDRGPDCSQPERAGCAGCTELLCWELHFCPEPHPDARR